jgi:thioredoxin-like negative regulator of GroEL
MSRAGGQQAPPPTAAVTQDQIKALEGHFKARPGDLNAGMQLATLFLQAQQFPKATEVLDQVLTNSAADANMLAVAANYYLQMGAVAKTENALQLLVKKVPDNPEGRFDLAAILAYQNKTPQALEALSNALQQNAARLTRDAAAPNLYPSATTDTRLASLRALPEFQRLVDSFKPK